jgi:hypothetical protein
VTDAERRPRSGPVNSMIIITTEIRAALYGTRTTGRSPMSLLKCQAAFEPRARSEQDALTLGGDDGRPPGLTVQPRGQRL